ncbi:hypothetical protein [Halosimplex carlsbadense]|nr:hypothetical protein [Halosimplex carlsbadense]
MGWFPISFIPAVLAVTGCSLATRWLYASPRSLLEAGLASAEAAE